MGFGTSLYFHRALAAGVYEAEVWITLLYLPIFPIGSWIIRPISVREENHDGIASEIYEFYYLMRRPTTATRFVIMLCGGLARVSAVLGPVAVVYIEAISAQGGKPSALKAFMFVGAFVWGLGLCLFWAARRDRIYGTAELPESLSSKELVTQAKGRTIDDKPSC
jgi:hypothetical protein